MESKEKVLGTKELKIEGVQNENPLIRERKTF